MMTIDNFIDLQIELWWAFGWFARWWLILLFVAAFAMAAMLFFFSVVSNWLETGR
jgi:uncharacterized protein involved in exopolysaccharide biosynthesis